MKAQSHTVARNQKQSLGSLQLVYHVMTILTHRLQILHLVRTAMRPVPAVVNLQATDAPASGTPSFGPLERLERVQSIDCAHQNIQCELFSQMGALGNQFLSLKGPISHFPLSAVVWKLADLVAGQSLSPFLGHVFPLAL